MMDLLLSPKKLILLLLFILLLSAFLLPVKTMAADPFEDVCKNSTAQKDSSVCNKSTGNPISGKNGVITKATKIVAAVVGIASVIMIVISGFQFITSGGDPQKVTTARQTILYAVIGLLIAVLAQALVSFVLNKV